MKPIVALVGRPNVGKSALFNRLLLRGVAIVENIPGVTRDRIYADCEWQGQEFILVDTGGLLFDDHDDFTDLIRKQAQEAIQEADLIVLVVDGRAGVTPGDREIAHWLRRAKSRVLLAVNKGEGDDALNRSVEFYQLGMGDPHTVSALHGLGTGELLDAMSQALVDLPTEESEEEDEELRVAVVGKPNVGKSTLINHLLGEERLIVSPHAGTTRDAIDVPVTINDRPVVLVDTAGLRRQTRIKEKVERYSSLRSLRAIRRAHVVVLVIDGAEGMSSQDRRIAGYIDEAGRALVLAVNKWDLVQDTDTSRHAFIDHLRWQLGFVGYAPIVFISALTGKGISSLLSEVLESASQHERRLPTAVLNEVLHEAFAMHPPPMDRGKAIKLYYATQVGSRPPRILAFVNDPRRCPQDYKRYLEGRLRDAFGLEGSPIRLHFRSRR